MSRFPLKSLALALSLALAGIAGAQGPLYWYYYDVDTTQDFGRYSSIAYDSKGKLRVGYRGARSVKYAQFDGTFWTREVADTSTAVDAKMAMVLDKAGNPHIFFQNGEDTQIHYVRKDGGKWTRALVDSGGHGAYYQMSAAADAKDVIHFIYNRYNNGGVDLTYTTVEDGKAAAGQSVCVKCGYTGKWNDILINSQGKPAISYFRDFPRNLNFAIRDTGTWNTVGLDDLLGKSLEGYFNSVTEDTGGAYYISYQNPRLGRFQIVHGKPGGEWKIEDLDTLTGFSTFGNQSHVFMARGGVPHVIYSRLQDSDPNFNKIGGADLIMGYRAGNVWKAEVVDTVGIVGVFASVALSPEGLPAVSYADLTNGYLRVAIASLTKPADEDGNGIPDYREVVSVRKPRAARKSPAALRGAEPEAFDAKGKTVLPPGKRGAERPAGIYLRPAR